MARVTRAAALLCVVALTRAGGEVVEASDAASLFDGCEISESEPGARAIKCEGVVASVFTGTALAETMIEASLNGLRSGFKGPVIASAADVEVGGVKRPGRRFSLFAKDREPALGEGVIVAVPVEGAAFRVINCAGLTAVAGSAARRDRMVEALAESLPAPTAPSAPSEWGPDGTTLAGRPLAMPDGCAAVAPGHIRCEAAELSWRHVTQEFDLMAVLGPVRIEYAKLGKVKETVVGCRLQGEPGECRSITVQPPEGEPLFVLLGMGAVRGHGLLAECDSLQELRSRLPAPCDQVFTLD